jgi:pilus assembly protein FimV
MRLAQCGEASDRNFLNLQSEVVRVERIRYELNEPSSRSNSYLFSCAPKLLFLVGALTFTSQVWSLGLGNLEVASNLDEPLDIRIELVSGLLEEIDTAEAALASNEEFDLIGLQRPDYLNEIVFTIVPAGQGDGANSFVGPYLQLTSKEQVKEPFLHFLVRLNWNGGRILREYTALIDPPVYAAVVPAQISTPRVISEPESNVPSPVVIDAIPLDDSAVQSAEAIEEDISDASEDIAPRPDDAANSDVSEPGQEDASVVFVDGEATIERSADGTYATYGPTSEGDTLSDIASQLSAQFPDIDMYQVMYVLVNENPEAFVDGNMNLLMKGQILQLSTVENLREVAPEEARSEFRVHLAQWDGYSEFAAQTGDSVLISSEPAGTYGADSGSATGADFDSTGGVSGDTRVEGTQDSVGEFGAAEDNQFAENEFDAAGNLASDEQFQIGSAGGFDGAADGQGPGNSEQEVLTMQGQVAELESALFSRNLENDDLRQRVALLEDQLTDVNALIALGDAELAALQASVSERNVDVIAPGASDGSDQFAENSEADGAVTAMEETDIPGENAPVGGGGDVVDEGTAESELANSPAEQPDSDGESVVATAAPAAVTQAATMNSRSWWSRLVESLQGVSTLVMILVGLFVVGLAGLIYLRRRRALEEFEQSM